MNNKKGNIIFLGTGTSTGVPVIGIQSPVFESNNPKDQRLRSSLVVQINDKNLLMDCGPDFRQQFLRAQLTTIDAIIFTHEHNDHVNGLDDIRPLAYVNQSDIPIYLEERVLKELQRRYYYMFLEHKYPGVAGLDVHIIDESLFDIDGIKIIPLRVMHGNLPILGYRIDDMAYITDASDIPENTLSKMMELEVLIINALRLTTKHPSHYIMPEVLEIIEYLAPKKAYITHISHWMGFHDQVQADLPTNVFLAYDGLEISL